MTICWAALGVLSWMTNPLMAGSTGRAAEATAAKVARTAATVVNFMVGELALWLLEEEKGFEIVWSVGSFFKGVWK